MKRLTLWGVTLAAATVALAGCEKPGPGITVWSGTNSAHTSALCWSFEAASPVDEVACAESIVAGEGGEIPRLSIINGNTVGISVDPVIADNGWFPVINNQALTEPIFSTYWRFTFPDFEQIPGEGLELQVRALTEGEETRGLWAFQLQRAAAE
jgi:hypothetical protein